MKIIISIRRKDKTHGEMTIEDIEWIELFNLTENKQLYENKFSEE